MDFPDNIANDIDGEHYQIMQFTGLLDKNGKEIYEGDILGLAEGVYGTWEVFWDDDFKGFSLSKTEEEIAGLGETLNKDVFDGITTEAEIIGNIYENPELING
jgi:uncharacterized phage protein (TIGR01671 family)